MLNVGLYFFLLSRKSVLGGFVMGVVGAFMVAAINPIVQSAQFQQSADPFAAGLPRCPLEPCNHFMFAPNDL